MKMLAIQVVKKAGPESSLPRKVGRREVFFNTVY